MLITLETSIFQNGQLNEEQHKTKIFKGHRRIAGFKAQEVLQAIEETYGSSDYASIVDHITVGGFDRYTMDYNQLIPFMVSAIQDLSARIKVVKQKIADKKAELGK